MTLETCRDSLADARAQPVMGIVVSSGKRALKKPHGAPQQKVLLQRGDAAEKRFSAPCGSDGTGNSANSLEPALGVRESKCLYTGIFSLVASANLTPGHNNMQLHSLPAS